MGSTVTKLENYTNTDTETKRQNQIDMIKKFSEICNKINIFCTKTHGILVTLESAMSFLKLASRTKDSNDSLAFSHCVDESIKIFTSSDINNLDSISDDIQRLQQLMIQDSRFDTLSIKMKNIDNISEIKNLISSILKDIQVNDIDKSMTSELTKKMEQMQIHVSKLRTIYNDIITILKVHFEYIDRSYEDLKRSIKI
jgi:hypothetical protein